VGERVGLPVLSLLSVVATSLTAFAFTYSTYAANPNFQHQV
jgi:hypothetical protein